MSTKNDKTNADLIELSNQLLFDFNGLENLEIYWFSHSRRQIDREFKEKYNCSYYYAKQIFNKIFNFRDRLPEEFVVIQHNNMDKTNLERYGRTNLGQFGTEEHTKAIKNKYGVDNPAKSKEIQQKIRDTMLRTYGVEYNLQSQLILDKIKQTNVERYGVEFPLQSSIIREKATETIIKTYGIDNPAKVPKIQDKIKQTNLERYGVEQFVQSDRYQAVVHKKYYYDNIYFDSSWELALWIFAKDHNEEIERCPIKFEYYVGDKLHYYFPDFRYKNKIIEIKGNQFLDENGALKVCYSNMTDEIVKAKHKCILDNKVEIWPKNKVQFALDYIKQTYGKDYLKQFKNTSERKE